MEKTKREIRTPEAELEEIASRFRHLRGVAKGEREGGTTRRHQHGRMDELERRFETLLARWVPDDKTRARWRAHLHEGAEAPEAPAPPRALVFKGRTEEGMTVAIRESADGTQEILVDGHPATRPAARVVPQDLPLCLLGRDFAECFDAPGAALVALRSFFAAPAGDPPWEWARALLDDGLIDRDFSLTARGRRLLAREGP